MMYFADHWRGKQPLAQAFWINLLALRGLALWLDTLFRPLADRDPDGALLIYVPFVLIFHVRLFVWQIVGTVRALDAFIAGRGAMYLIWGTQIGIAFTVGATIVQIIASVQPMLLGPPGEPLHMIWERERASKYEIAVSPNGDVLSITGEFELGLSKAMRKILAKHTGVRVVSLQSHGGLIHAGRAVAKVIEDHGLETYVEGTCQSACSTAFMAGSQRILGPDGRIGFHQYGDEAPKPNPFSDLKAEQERDRAYFAGRGVDATFLKKIFDAPTTSIWFPTQAELLEAHAVHVVREK